MPNWLQMLRMKSNRLTAGVFFLLALIYPVLVYFGLKLYSPKAVSLALAILLLLRWLSGGQKQGRKRLGLLLVLPLTLCAISALVNNRVFILYLPVLFSLSLLCSFGFTLLRPPSAIETLAKLQVPDLSSEELAHCRRATQIWTAFFFLN